MFSKFGTYFFIFFNLVVILNCTKKKEDPVPVVVIPDPIVVVDTFTANSCGNNQTTDEITKDGWVKIWGDEFDNNLNEWKKWIGGAFNGEYQYYNSEKNLILKDGILKITPRLESITGAENPFTTNQKNFNYTSGRIESGYKFSPNGVNYSSLRIIARIKTPSGIGMWPAFWAYGDAWPTNGEIDILEQNGANPKEFSSTYHYGDIVNQDQWIPGEVGYFKSDTDLTTCWHVYECIWEKDKLTYIFDGKEYFANTGRNVPKMFNKMQNIVLNLAVGGNFVGNPSPSNIKLNPMYVDWVRVYSK